MLTCQCLRLRSPSWCQKRFSSTVLPHLDLGGGVCVSRLPWQKKGVKIAFSKGKPGIGLFPPPTQISRVESRTSLGPVLTECASSMTALDSGN